MKRRLLALALCTSCGGDVPAEPPAVVSRDSAGVLIVENTIPSLVTPACSIATEPTTSIGSVDGSDSYLLHRVTGALVLDDGSIAIGADGVYDIRVFGPDGAFRRSIGRRGEGPGEFRNIMRLFLLGADTVVVEDYRPWRLSYFTSDGRFHRAVVPQPLNANRPDRAVLRADGSIVSGHDCCLRREPGFHLQTLQLVLHAREGFFVDTIGTYPFGSFGLLPNAGRDGSFMRPLFEGVTSIASYGMHTIIGDQQRQELVILGPDLQRQTLLRWRIRGRDGSREVRRLDVEAYRQRRLVESTPAIRQFVEEDISPERPVSDSFPAFSGILASREGEIAVRLYRRRFDDETDSYLLFDRQQRFTCTLRLSKRRALWRLGDGHVLLHEYGDMDVERIARYELIH